MKRTKWMATALAVIMAAGMMFSTGTESQAAASAGSVYVVNQTGLTMVSISTPVSSIKLYSGLTWEQLEGDVGVRLNATVSDAGADARNAFISKATSVKGTVIKLLDMDLEKYLGGWTSDITSTVAPLRIAISLPTTADQSLDYAIVSLKADGSLEVLGDLDANPGTITVDSSSFDTFAIISGAKGAFNAYKVPSATALTAVSIANYAKKVSSTVRVDSVCAYVYDAGIITDADRTHVIAGNNAYLKITDATPGATAAASLQSAALAAGAKKYSYFTAALTNGSARISTTPAALRVTMSAPYNDPAYGDYAIAMLNADGTTTVYKDIDTNDSTITVDLTQFRDFAILWGPKGAFKNVK